MSLPPPSADSFALVTGASAGIGREFARALAERGYSLALVARRAERLEELAGELREARGVRVEVLPCDLSDRAARNELVAEADRRGLAVDVLVNNAGFGIYRAFAASNTDDELDELEVLFGAVLHLDSVYLPRMVERRRGAIINVASTSGFQPLPGNSTYAAAKAATIFHSEALSHEVKGTGVTVTVVCPGPVHTEFQETSEPLFLEGAPKFVWVTAERVVSDALLAAERGKRMVIPGGPGLRALFAPNRFAPASISLPVAGKIMSKEMRLGEGGD